MQKCLVGVACLVTLAISPLLPSVSAQPTPDLGVDVSHFDTTIRPQDDFYRYVNGAWLKETEIPADRSNYGAFTVLDENAQHDLREIIEEAANASNRMEGTDVQKVGDLYLSFMDSVRVERLGLSPLREELRHIDAIQTKDDLIRYFGYSQRLGIGIPISIFVDQDEKNASQYILYVTQSGLGMPDRDYYMGDQFQDTRDAYLTYIRRMFNLADWRNGDEAAVTILDIETRLAQGQWTRVQNRDRNATYNRYTIEDANTLAPNLDWKAFMKAANIPTDAAFIIRQPSYVESFSEAIDEIPLKDWKTYLRFHLLNSVAPYLPRQFVQASFNFNGKALSGIQQLSPRWKRGVNLVDGALGEMVGKMYVERHFKPEAKARMDEMIRNLREAFRQSIDQLDWMSTATKQEAQAKLLKFTPKIGYPDKWKDYTALEIDRGDLLGNVLRSDEVEYERGIAKLDQPVDRSEWFMTPQTVNAYYNPSMNEVVFPAAILQPPFFNVEADDATNYGAIGAVIGHELSHGFDDQGRRSDGDGNLRDWWTPEDEKEFKARAQKLVDEYNAFNPIDTLHVNGALTLGENIGDLAGVTMAYRAYKLSLNGKEAPVIDGFTGDQRFFLGYAQIWARKYRDNELRRRLITDPHAINEYRANGILVNIPAFYEAWDVKPGDGMYRAPEDRVKIW